MSTLEIKAAEPVTVPLADIKIDPDLQCRARGINKRTVQEYREAMHAAGVSSFPPITLFKDSRGVLWLADGFQRCAAAALLGLEGIELPADIRKGSRKDALLYAAGANASHGSRRTQHDVRRAIGMLLQAFPDYSDRKIAKAVGCHNETVGAVRKRLTESVTPEAPSAEAHAPAPEEAPAPATDAAVAKLSKALQRILEQWPASRRAELQERLLEAATAPQAPPG